VTSLDAFSEALHYDQIITETNWPVGDPALAHYIRQRDFFLDLAAKAEREGK
jgi:hypothetical protein